MRKELKLTRKDFCITVSLTGYRISYKGHEIGSNGRSGWSSALTGYKASNRRFYNALCADIEVSRLINGEGCPIQLCHIRNVENKLS